MKQLLAHSVVSILVSSLVENDMSNEYEIEMNSIDNTNINITINTSTTEINSLSAVDAEPSHDKLMVNKNTSVISTGNGDRQKPQQSLERRICVSKQLSLFPLTQVFSDNITNIMIS